MSKKFAVILPAAGGSSRFKHQHYKKQFAPLSGRAVWLHTAERFVNRDDVGQVILAISPDDRETFADKFGSNIAFMDMDLTTGGATRAETVEKALAKVKPELDYVCVHDAARPCVAEDWITRIFDAAEQHEAVIFALPIAGTIKRVANHKITETVDREGLWEAQTPQVFRKQLLLDAYAKRGDFAATDEASLVERLGVDVHVLQGSPINLKITTQEDLRLAEHTLKAVPKPKAFGPAHPFKDDDIWR